MLDNIEFDHSLSDFLYDVLIDKKTKKNPKILTKSKFLNGLQCPKLLWTRCNAPQEIPDASDSLQHIFDTGNRVGELARTRFPGGICVQQDDFTKNIEETKTLLSSYKAPIYEGGVLSGRIYSRGDILKPSQNKLGYWDVVEVKCGTKLKEIYLQDIAFQKYCYEQAGLKIDRCYLMHVNNEYVRQEDIDVEGFFTLLDVTSEIIPFYGQVPNLVKGFLDIVDLPSCPQISIRGHCAKPYECQMKSVCWSFLPDGNVTQLYRGMSKRFDLLEQGIMLIKDIPDKVKLTDNQTIQRQCAITGQEYINKPEIENFIKGLRYPLHFMDFETIFEVIPRFEGTRPYQQVPFQFSVHVKKSSGSELVHFYYLHKSTDDPRKSFIDSLSKCIGSEGDIIVYNQSFEEGRLKELGNFFPEYAAFCQKASLRMIDLLIPFRKFYYYHPAQKGSASIKKVLPVLVGKGYEGMAIADGGKASSEYLRVMYGQNIAIADRLEVHLALENYCQLDTKAMEDILRNVKEKIN